MKDRILTGIDAGTSVISVTVQGDGMWHIDKAGEPVGPATIWLYSRAASIVEGYVASKHYPAHYERTGTGLTVVQMSGKLAWMKRHRPELPARATHTSDTDLRHAFRAGMEAVRAKGDAQLEDAMAEGRKRMIAATVEKMKLYGCAGKAHKKA